MKKKFIIYVAMASLLCWASIGVWSGKTPSMAAEATDGDQSTTEATDPTDTTTEATDGNEPSTESTDPTDTTTEATDPTDTTTESKDPTDTTTASTDPTDTTTASTDPTDTTTASSSGSGSSKKSSSSSKSSGSNSNAAPASQPATSSIGAAVNMSDAISQAQSQNSGVVTLDTATPISSADLRKVAEMGGQLNVFSGPGVLWHFSKVTNPDAELNPVVDIGADIPDLRARMNGVQGTMIRFMHNGVLPGAANVALNVPYAPGTTLYFYYYNRSTQQFEYQQSTTVANGGYVVVNLTHCSDYVLTTQPLTSGVANGPVPTTRNAGKLDGTPHTGI